MTNPEQTFSLWLIRHRWQLLVLMPLIVLVLASGIKHLKFTPNYRVFFSEDNPQLQAFDRLENTYTQDDNVIFLLIPQNSEIFSRETLAAVEALTEKAWQIPYSLRVDSVTNFQYTEARGDDLIVGDLVRDANQLSDAQIARIRDIALADPLLAGKLISEKGDVTVVNVTIQLPRGDETKEIQAVTESVREIADKMRALHPHLDIHLTGMVMMNSAFFEAFRGDMRSLTPIGIGVMLVVLVLLLRSVLATVLTLTVILMSILAGMGAGGHLGLPITSPASSAPLVILTMAIANSVHVLVVFYQELRSNTYTARLEAMQESLRINLQPIFFTSLTTVIGFLTLNFSEVPPYRDLGNFAAAGIGMAFLLSITFLPALMTLLPARARPVQAENIAMIHFGEFVVRHRYWLLWTTASIVLLLIAFIPRNEINDIYVHYFDESIAFRQDTDLLDKHLGGLYRIDYSLDSGNSGGISDPVFLRKADAFTGWLRQQPEVTHVDTVTDIFKRLNKNLHADDPTWYRLPDTRDLAAQYLLLYEMSLPYGLDLNNRINVDKSATRINVSTRVLSTKEILALELRIHQWLSDNAPTLLTEGSSPTIMFAYIGARNIRSLMGGTTLALILISLILIAALRSFKIGIISIIPNLVPAGMAFGLWGIFVGEVGLALSVVTAMTLGIVVDDTVHFLSKYLRARREQGASPENAIRYAFSHVGVALIITSLVLVAGFLIIALSDFYPNTGMGIVTAMVLVLALLADFLFLPPLLIKLDSDRRN
uniref:SSD domain-containing protein n=1 Tax=Candidatus Kentrum sp. MB TaxID=2138164 RepID=A0A450Y026_9GAMM|nr:MAG: hypothetical protein BECKMB1821G_GA0114241_10913 [Candidatus Kentron sp. MB]VFK34884.1 MAG: hypothetical protein BECKMB1821I_GA0114274_10893 [Candidatus Kentron sp. MB]VFK77019.1 MAG: hypothetical protein BECKMB1821H_GA0114242_10913 [Candidatus Kentron sp. MB]